MSTTARDGPENYAVRILVIGLTEWFMVLALLLYNLIQRATGFNLQKRPGLSIDTIFYLFAGMSFLFLLIAFYFINRKYIATQYYLTLTEKYEQTATSTDKIKVVVFFVLPVLLIIGSIILLQQ